MCDGGTLVKVRELALRLATVSGSVWTPDEVVALVEAAGVPVGVSGSVTESQVFVMLGQTELPCRDLMPQLMAEVWPPEPSRPRRVDVPGDQVPAPCAGAKTAPRPQ